MLAISLGSAYSTVAFLPASEDSSADIVVNAEGDRIIPTLITRTEVSVGDDEDSGGDNVEFEEHWLYGSAAKQNASRHSDTTYTHLSKPSSIRTVDTLIRRVNPGDDGRNLPLLSKYLASLRQMAEESLAVKCDNLILTTNTGTTTNSSDDDFASLKQSAVEAGFKRIEFIDESMAALLGHLALNSMDSSSYQSGGDGGHMGGSGGAAAEQVYLVIDCGATGVKLNLIARRAGVYVQLARRHLSTEQEGVLSGDAVDCLLFDYFRAEFQRKTRSELTNRRSKAKLWLACEQLKKTLSKSANAFISVDSLQDGLDFHSSLHQLKFESLINPLLTRLADEIERFMASAAAAAAVEVDQVLLVGGMARLPKVDQLVKFIFPRSPVNQTTTSSIVDPQEIFALGASYEFAQKQDDASLPAVSTIPALPYGIGIRTATSSEGAVQQGNGEGGEDSGEEPKQREIKVKPLIRPFHPLPLKHVFELEVLQSQALVQLVAMMKDSGGGHKLIDEYYLDGIDPENPSLQCILSIDSSGVLSMNISQ